MRTNAWEKVTEKNQSLSICSSFLVFFLMLTDESIRPEVFCKRVILKKLQSSQKHISEAVLF